MRRSLLLAACLTLLLASAGCGGEPTARKAPATPGIRDLNQIRDLRAAFNAHPGVPRLIVLVSPT